MAGMTRQADISMIKELMFEGSNRFFDKSICLEMNVTDGDIHILCDALQ